MLKKLPLKTGYEFDAFTGYKRYIKWRAGMRKKCKKSYNKRMRREADKEMMNEIKFGLANLHY
jgi:hypothetical protein